MATNKTSRLSCNGYDSNNIGHPVVYLYLSKSHSVVRCPYCNSTYDIRGKTKDSIAMSADILGDNKIE